MTTEIPEVKNAEDTSVKYSEKQMDETMKYLSHLKVTNKKLFNKYNKQGRKFGDSIMKRLKK